MWFDHYLNLPRVSKIIWVCFGACREKIPQQQKVGERVKRYSRCHELGQRITSTRCRKICKKKFFPFSKERRKCWIWIYCNEKVEVIFSYTDVNRKKIKYIYSQVWKRCETQNQETFNATSLSQPDFHSSVLYIPGNSNYPTTQSENFFFYFYEW